MTPSAAQWSEALALYGQALDLPTERRNAWATALRVSEPVARALRQLLDDRRAIETGRFLEHGPVLATSASLAPGLPPVPQPERVGPYRLLRELGKGGMSTVYLAERDDAQLKRQVALKLPHAGPGQRALAQRLLRERDALVGLEHPNIARLYDVVLTGDGVPCLVLEFIEGEPIDAYCARHALDLAARLRLFSQALRAVQFAHSHLVLHRDLKPSNILVSTHGEVKLLDFGIAKMLDERADGVTSALTRHGGAPMTPDYAAPEQIAGGPLGTACDVYAMGVLLYELMTGVRAYRLPRGTRGELEEAILAADPLRPSERWRQRPAQDALPFSGTPAGLRRLLSGDLDVIVLHALRKQPNQRYATADAFSLDLQRWLANEPIAVHPDRPGDRLLRFVQRHCLVVVAGALVSLSVIGGLAAALWQASVAQAEARKSLAIKEFLIGLFEAGSLNQADAARKSRQTVRELLEHSATALRSGLSQQPEMRSEVQGLVGRLLSDLALTDSALALRHARAEQLAARDAPLPERGEALRELAQTHEQRGESELARATLLTAVALLKDDARSPVQVQRWAAESALGRMDLFSAHIEEARVRIEPSAEALGRLTPNSDLAADALADLSLLRHEQGRPDEALALQHQALDIKVRLFAGQGARLARERFRHAMMLWQPLGDLGAAEPEMQRAWREMQASAGPEHVDTALIELQWGLLQLYRGDEAGALSLLSHARGVLEREAGRIDPDHLLSARLYLVEVHLQAGRFDQAAPLLAGARSDLAAQPEAGSLLWRQYADLQQVELWSHVREDARALELLAQWRERLTPPGDALQGPELIDLTQREAAVHQAAGRPARALAILDELARSVPSSASDPVVAARRCGVLLDLGRGAEALPLAQTQFDAVQAKPVRLRLQTENAAAHQRLARAWIAVGEPQRALPLFEQARALYAGAGEDHLFLAALRARHGQALAATGQRAEARREIDLAVATMRRQPRLGPVWWRAVSDAESLLSRGAADSAPSSRHP